MAQIPNQEPAQIVAGDTLLWHKQLPDYPAGDGWVLHYRLINAAGKIDIESSADGDTHVINVSAAATAAYAAGSYSFQAYVSKDAARFTVGTGSIFIKPDLAAEAAGLDVRSSARKALDALNLALENYGKKAWMQQYSIAGRSMTFRNPGEFLAMRSQLQQEVNREVAAERVAAGLPSRRKVFVRFGK